ncbi:MAG TPA: hypothetical protein H9717_06970 [Candidatus Eisenbergiella merdipullorum]|uniref:Cohesin domain-containing protein n=1 Tax=Candidatus Eisenbergiella merdipullorum TaxID=2838553 RepID=A0A9D2I6P2_9FIRM|nr:hypothetical protein [Candidatus Eisenbergiella merdipullorum]
MFRITDKMNLKTAALLLAGLLGVTAAAPVTAQAAPVSGEGTITAEEDMLSLDIGETGTVKVDYDLAGGFADLAVLTADPGIAAVVLTDNGNGTATLTAAAVSPGTTVAAVYRISNAAVVDYITIRSGLAQEGEVYTQMNGTSLVTVYEDRMVYYNSTLTGRNGASVAISGIGVERESGLDCLKVTGSLLSGDAKTPGMNIFYADFYGAAGELIKRQALYTRNPVSGNTLELEWYIPEGCTMIVLE